MEPETEGSGLNVTAIKMSLAPDLTRQFLQIIDVITDDFRLNISKEGWKVTAVNPANVAMVDLNLPKDNFHEWEFNNSDNWTSSIDGHPTGVLANSIDVGIEIDKIKEFICGMSDQIEHYLPEELTDPIEFSFYQESPDDGHGGSFSPRYKLHIKQGMFSRTMTLSPASSIRKNPNIPELSLDYRLQFTTLELRVIAQKAAKIYPADKYITLCFERKEGTVKFMATALDDKGEPWVAEKYISHWHALRDGARDCSSSLYSLDYLCEIMAVIPSESVWLHLGNDWPCVLSFTLGHTGTVTYMQAPKVESK